MYIITLNWILNQIQSAVTIQTNTSYNNLVFKSGFGICILTKNIIKSNAKCILDYLA